MHSRGERIETITASDPTAFAEGLIARALLDAVAERGRCLILLSGGRTPRPLYERLAERNDLPWSDVEVFWGDERFVPHDHPDSNAGAARSILLDRLRPAPERVHPWPILESASASARAYEAIVKERAGDPPLFDVNLLGLGDDCHTASLFPGGEGMGAAGLTVAARAPDGQERLSLTVPALSSSRLVIFLVSGDSKRPALTQLLSEQGDPAVCPARAIEARERLVLVTDLEVRGGH